MKTDRERLAKKIIEIITGYEAVGNEYIDPCYKPDIADEIITLLDFNASQQPKIPSDDIELTSLRKQLDEATKYIKALEEREF